MPYKSKRNRRAMSHRTVSQQALSQNKNVVSSPVATASGPTAPATGVQSEKFTASYASTSRVAATAPAAPTYFFNELKWIGVTCGIIIVLLIISYFIFK